MSTEPAAPPAPPSRPPLSAFWHDLPREGRLLLSVVVLEFVGTGLVLPFSVVYLHEVRGIALPTVGLLLALPSLIGLLASAPGGIAIDRLGPRRVLITSLVLMIAADVVLASATSAPVAAAALTLNGLAGGLSFPAFSSFIADVVPSGIRQRYFGINFSLLNLGIGLGGVLGGLLVDVHRPATFQAIYLLDALSFVPALMLLIVPLRRVGNPRPHVSAHHPEHPDGPAAALRTLGYRAVLREPAMASLMVLVFLTAFVGYAQLNTGMPAFARAVSEVSTRDVGLAFAANTLVIVLLQLLVLQRIEGRRRTRVIVVFAAIWATAWMLLGVSGLLPGGLGATVLVTACAAVFGLGETLLQPTIPALVNDLAPDHLRGRYNALSSGVFQLAAIVAPPVAGLMIGRGLPEVWIAMLVAGCLLSAAWAVLRLEPVLPASVNGR